MYESFVDGIYIIENEDIIANKIGNRIGNFILELIKLPLWQLDMDSGKNRRLETEENSFYLKVCNGGIDFYILFTCRAEFIFNIKTSKSIHGPFAKKIQNMNLPSKKATFYTIEDLLNYIKKEYDLFLEKINIVNSIKKDTTNIQELQKETHAVSLEDSPVEKIEVNMQQNKTPTFKVKMSRIEKKRLDLEKNPKKGSPMKKLLRDEKGRFISTKEASKKTKQKKVSLSKKHLAEQIHEQSKKIIGRIKNPIFVTSIKKASPTTQTNRHQLRGPDGRFISAKSVTKTEVQVKKSTKATKVSSKKVVTKPISNVKKSSTIKKIETKQNVKKNDKQQTKNKLVTYVLHNLDSDKKKSTKKPETAVGTVYKKKLKIHIF